VQNLGTTECSNVYLSTSFCFGPSNSFFWIPELEMRIHIANDNFKWFNRYKNHVILRLFYPWSNTQVANDAKSLKYTGESRRTHRNTRIIVLWEVRISEQCHWRLKSYVMWHYVVEWAVPRCFEMTQPLHFRCLSVQSARRTELIDPQDVAL